MQLYKSLIFTLTIVVLNSCGFGMQEEINKESAENLINQNVREFDDEQLDECNADEIIFSDGNYLFVANSFNGDFNGYVYSTSQHLNLSNLKFDDLYIAHSDSPEGNWTKVYGKW